MKNYFLKNFMKLIVIKIFVLFIILIIQSKNVFAYWYEEPEIFETKNIDEMWWLRKKQKEELKKEQQKEIKKKIDESKNKNFKDKKIKWIYDEKDIKNFPKNKWELIDDDNDNKFYKYYFDKDGYLLIDTITDDYKIVDKLGREVNENNEAIIYDNLENVSYIEKIVVDEDDLYIQKSEPAKILFSSDVVIKKKEKIFDNTINKDVFLYEDKSYRFLKETKGTIRNKTTWKANSLKGNGGYIIFDNPKNNFNKISGLVAMEYYEFREIGNCILKVYDADLYDKYNEFNRLDELNEIFVSRPLNEIDYEKFDFSFDRSIKRLRFELETSENSKSVVCYLKNLKYGFSKSSFRDELIKKNEEAEEIEELKKLGIYVEDLWIFEDVDEDGNDIEEVYEDNEEYFNIVEETKRYEDTIRDRTTGPNFDKNLIEKKDKQKIGPGFINIK